MIDILAAGAIAAAILIIERKFQPSPADELNRWDIKLAEMQADLSWNQRDGNWYAYLPETAGKKLTRSMAWNRDPGQAVEELYGLWLEAGSPVQKIMAEGIRPLLMPSDSKELTPHPPETLEPESRRDHASPGPPAAALIASALCCLSLLTLYDSSKKNESAEKYIDERVYEYDERLSEYQRLSKDLETLSAAVDRMDSKMIEHDRTDKLFAVSIAELYKNSKSFAPSIIHILAEDADIK